MDPPEKSLRAPFFRVRWCHDLGASWPDCRELPMHPANEDPTNLASGVLIMDWSREAMFWKSLRQMKWSNQKIDPTSWQILCWRRIKTQLNCLRYFTDSGRSCSKPWEARRCSNADITTSSKSSHSWCKQHTLKLVFLSRSDFERTVAQQEVKMHGNGRSRSYPELKW